eukprot:1189233-Prorocentrum_minimum.AAC.2
MVTVGWFPRFLQPRSAMTPGRISGPAERSLLGGDPPARGPGKEAAQHQGNLDPPRDKKVTGVMTYEIYPGGPLLLLPSESYSTCLRPPTPQGGG